MEDQMFESLAVCIVDLEASIDELDETIREKKEALAETKRQLCELMMQQGLDGVKLSNGLSPRPKIQVDYFKAQGVSDEDLFAWLKAQSLDAIIKPSVHFQTLQATMREYVDHGGAVPPIFNPRETPTVVMGGKSKYLAARAMGEATENTGG